MVVGLWMEVLSPGGQHLLLRRQVEMSPGGGGNGEGLRPMKTIKGQALMTALYTPCLLERHFAPVDA